MNKIIIGVVIIVFAGIGWFLFQGETVEYVDEVHDEVAALEVELAEINNQVQAGTLSPAAAAVAQVKILSRIDSINTAAATAQNAKLADTQRAQLVDGLGRLKQILITYQATLVAVDEAVLVLPEAERPTLNRRGGGGRSGVAVVAVETIVATDEQIEEVIADITDEVLAEEVADTVEDSEITEETSTSSEDTLEAEIPNEQATDSDDVSEESTPEETQTDSTESTEEASTSTPEGSEVTEEETL